MPAETGIPKMPGDITGRLKHELPCGVPGMRHHQPGRSADEISMENHVQIDGTGIPPTPTLPAEFLFQVLQQIEHGAGGGGRLQHPNRIQKRLLPSGTTDRRCFE